jgi:hypothetical protein
MLGRLRNGKCLESGGGGICVGKPVQIIRPGYPGKWVRVQLLNLFATREVVGYANLNEERR